MEELEVQVSGDGEPCNDSSRQVQLDGKLVVRLETLLIPKVVKNTEKEIKQFQT